VVPKGTDAWSVTSFRQRLVKTGGLGQACTVLLAFAGGEPCDAAAVRNDAQPDLGAAGPNRLTRSGSNEAAGQKRAQARSGVRETPWNGSFSRLCIDTSLPQGPPSWKAIRRRTICFIWKSPRCKRPAIREVKMKIPDGIWRPARWRPSGCICAPAVIRPTVLTIWPEHCKLTGEEVRYRSAGKAGGNPGLYPKEGEKRPIYFYFKDEFPSKQKGGLP
jgi:hypothetical protein